MSREEVWHHHEIPSTNIIPLDLIWDKGFVLVVVDFDFHFVITLLHEYLIVALIPHEEIRGTATTLNMVLISNQKSQVLALLDILNPWMLKSLPVCHIRVLVHGRVGVLNLFSRLYRWVDTCFLILYFDWLSWFCLILKQSVVQKAHSENHFHSSVIMDFPKVLPFYDLCMLCLVIRLPICDYILN